MQSEKVFFNANKGLVLGFYPEIIKEPERFSEEFLTKVLRGMSCWKYSDRLIDAAQIQLCGRLKEMNIRRNKGRQLHYDVGHEPDNVQKRRKVLCKQMLSRDS